MNRFLRDLGFATTLSIFVILAMMILQEAARMKNFERTEVGGIDVGLRRCR